MSQGTIIKRIGKKGTSYLLKYEAGKDPITGKRRTRYKTIRGTRKNAQKALTALLNSVDQGTHVDPSKMTVNEWFDHWLTGRDAGLGMKTKERYVEILNTHVRPVIGQIKLQALNAGGAVTLQRVITTATGKGLSFGTVRYIVTLMKDIFKSAARRLDR